MTIIVIFKLRTYKIKKKGDVMEYTDFLTRMLVALLLSLTVGLERQWRRRAIGLRTNVLVCIGAFLFVSMPVMLDKMDDMKVAAQVVSGIGFLGAGVILKDGANIRGLNTAATLWCNAAIGVLCATGLLLEAITGTVFILGANIVLRYITKKLLDIHESKNAKCYNLTIVLAKDKEVLIRTMLIQIVGETNIKLNSIETEEKPNDRIEIIADISSEDRTESDIEHIITRFTMEPDVFYIGYKKQKESLIDDDDEN